MSAAPSDLALRSRDQAPDIGAVLEPEQHTERCERRRDRAGADGERGKRRRHARGERRRGRKPRECSDREPYQRESERGRPAGADQAAEKGRHALAAAKAQPHGIEMAEKGARRAGKAGRFVMKQDRRQEIREGRLQRVENERRSGEILAPCAQHIGRADIAGADGAQVRGAREPGQQEAERDRAEEIAERQRDERVYAVERNRHGRCAPRKNGGSRREPYSCAMFPATSVILTRPSSRAWSKGVLR